MLVHGSWHGGWCWRFVAPILRSAGHAAHTPTLTGLGPSSHLLDCGVDLNTHIQDVVNLLFYEDLSEVVLVGHSYAGMVITGVAASVPRRLARLVYLDAYVPAAGQSEIDLWSPEQQAAARADLAAGEEFRQPPPVSVLGITDPKMTDWVAARLTPQPLATYDQPAPPGSPDSAAIPRTFIHCTVGPAASLMARFAAHARAEQWDVRELATGHDAMLTVPDELARLLADCAA